ncbi:hypothetical protein C8R47DRAFT_1271102, partial [Mycena vitilis]
MLNRCPEHLRSLPVPGPRTPSSNPPHPPAGTPPAQHFSPRADDGVGYGPPSPNFPNRSTGWTRPNHRRPDSASGFLQPSPSSPLSSSSSSCHCGSSAPELRSVPRAGRKESPLHSDSTHQHQSSCMLCTFCPHHQPLVDALLAQASSHAREPQLEASEWPQPSVSYAVPPPPPGFYPATLPS